MCFWVVAFDLLGSAVVWFGLWFAVILLMCWYLVLLHYVVGLVGLRVDAILVNLLLGLTSCLVVGLR